jgi:single-stranded DNA-binding protein
MSGIECAFNGFLAADAVSQTSKAGKQWVRLRVGVGEGDAVQWVGVAVFGTAAVVAASLKKGDRVYVEGSIKIDTWRGNDGVEKHSLSVASFKVEKTHQIGRNRPSAATQREKPPAPAASGRERAARSDYAPAGGVADLNDAIPF